MAENVKGQVVVDLLKHEDIVKAFADTQNPIEVQVVDSLGFLLTTIDVFQIRKAFHEDGPTTAGDMLRQRLIHRYNDKPDVFTLQQFIDALANIENVRLKTLLLSACDSKATISSHQMVRNIKAYLRYACENVQQVWDELLNETSLEKCFVVPDLLEWRKMTKEERRKRKEQGIEIDGDIRMEAGKIITNYEQLFRSEMFGDRIVIEGDPGMGKTTYVNKLALDWTWDEGTKNFTEDSRFLKSTFTVVFLIPLRDLNGPKSLTFSEAADTQLINCGTWLNAEFESHPCDCLLILDGFDEYDTSSCPEVNEIIQGKRFPCLRVIITTRSSHINKLKIKNHWLSVSGLTTAEKQEQFLTKQGWDKLKDRNIINCELSRLGTCGIQNLWQTPLHLVMLCVLYEDKEETNFEPQQADSFHVLVKSFTDHIMSRCVTEKGLKLTPEERVKVKSYVQQLAYQQFLENNPWLRDAMNGNYQEVAIQDTGPSSLFQGVVKKKAGQFGLILIKEKRSTKTGEVVEKVSFIHQIFLEYYAAVQFVPIITDCPNKDRLMKMIEENLYLVDLPFSYFLAEECNLYKQMLYKVMVTSIKAHLHNTAKRLCHNLVLVTTGKFISSDETSDEMLEKCFFPIEIIAETTEESAKNMVKERGNIVNNYEDIFQYEWLGDRIVIKGDPGIGKTTYVSKLVLDWTREDGSTYYSENSRFLQSTFSIIFLIPLRHLNGMKSLTFSQAADIQLENCGTWLAAEFQRHPGDCLLILDAFDEYDGSCPEVNEIISGNIFPQLKVIITTRPSHMGILKVKNRWLTIMASRWEQFLINPGCDNIAPRQ